MTQDKTRSIGRKLLAGSLLRVGHLIAAGLCSFFLMPFVVHHLGDRVYGFWSLAATFIGYYELLDFGLSTAISQYLSIAIGRSDQAECRGVFNTALRIQTLLGAVALLATAAIAVATPWLTHNPADVHQFWKVIVLLGLNAAIGFPTRVYGAVLGAELRFDIQATLSIIGLVLRTGLVVLAITYGGNLLALASVTLLASLPVIFLQIWCAQRVASWARIEVIPLDSQRVKSLFSYSIYNFLAYLADMLRFQVDPVVISALIGLSAVTHYRVAGVFAQYYLQILIVTVGMLQPVFSRFHGAGNTVDLERVFFFGTKVSLCISVFICVGLIAWGRPLILRWMGVQYGDAYWPLVALSIAVFFDVSQKPSIDLLYATFKHRFYTYMNWAEGLLNLLFSILLARPFGILGVAMGTLIGAFLIRVIVQPWWVCKVAGLGYSRYVQFVGGNLLYCGAVMGGAVAVAAWGLRSSYVLLLSSGLCAAVIYVFGCWTLILNDGERRQLRAIVASKFANGHVMVASA